MAGKRTLDIPVYEADGEPDEDGVYGTRRVDDSQPPPSQRTSRPRRGRSGSGFPTTDPFEEETRSAPPTFDEQDSAESEERAARFRAEQAARDAAAEQARLRADAQAGNLGAKLTMDSRAAGDALIEKMRTSGIAAADTEPAVQRQRLTGMQKAFGGLMVVAALEPLRGGMRADNVAQSIGMISTMWMLSPTFRQQVGDQFDSLKAAAKRRAAEKDAAEMHKRGGKLHRLEERKGGRDNMSRGARTRLEQLEFVERGGRLPYSAHSAALAEVGLAESAYYEMRQPGADIEGIRDAHRSGLMELYTMAEQDGVDREEISQHMRLIVGTRMDYDPNMAGVFEGLAHGRYVKAAPTNVPGPDGSTRPLWRGEFVDTWDGQIIDEGSFAPRAPMSAVDHRVEIADTMMGDLVTSGEASDATAALDRVMGDYALGVHMATRSYTADYLDDPETARRMNRSRQMFAAMNADGVPLDEARRTYAGAYVDAMSAMASRYPDRGAAWAAQYGEDWRERMAQRLQDFAEYGDRVSPPEPESGAHAFFDDTFTQTGFDEATDDLFPAAADENIVDADLVEDEPVVFRASTSTVWAPEDDLGDPSFIATPYVDGGGRRAEVFDSISEHIAEDLRRAHLAGGDPARGVGIVDPIRVYGSPGWAGKDRQDLPQLLSGDSRVRAESLLNMDAALAHSGVRSQRARDTLLSAAFVQGIERASVRHPKIALQHEQLMASRMGGNTANWQEYRFADAMATTETGRAAYGPDQRPLGYRQLVRALGLDPDRPGASQARSAADDEHLRRRGPASSERERESVAPENTRRPRRWFAWMKPDVTLTAVGKQRRALINQQYNNQDELTDKNFGIGADRAQILQDMDWQPEPEL